MKVAVTLAFTAALASAPLAFAQGEEKSDAASKELTGEIVDMMCYVDHNAIGEKHANCGEKCIKNGGPVGILSDGKAILVVGAQEPAGAARRQNRYIERQVGEQRRGLHVGECRDR